MKKVILFVIVFLTINNFIFPKTAEKGKYEKLYTEYKKLTVQYTKLLSEHKKAVAGNRLILSKIKKLVKEHDKTLLKFKSSNDKIKVLILEIQQQKKLIELLRDTKKQVKPRFNIIYYLGYENQFKTGLDLRLRLYSVWKMDFSLRAGINYLGSIKTFNFNGYLEVRLSL